MDGNPVQQHRVHTTGLLVLSYLIWIHTTTRDKRLTHSVPGIFFLWLILAAVLLIPVMLAMGSTARYLMAAFLGGVMLGLVLHLLQDLCTRKGITPLFPFSTVKVAGSIRPCNTTDRRIAQFHFFHCSVAGILTGLQIIGDWQVTPSLPLCILALGSCLGMMIWSSDVELPHEPDGNGFTPVPLTVLSGSGVILGNPEESSSGLLMGVYYFNKSERWDY